MSDEPSDLIVMAAICLALVLAAVGIKAFGSSQESKAYNRLTGAQTTWWDAMWVELRVQEGAKP